MLKPALPSEQVARSGRRKTLSGALGLEQLECRLAHANLTITAIQLVDGDDHPITAPVLGQQVFYRASWTAAGCSDVAQYVVRYTVDGVSVDSPPLAPGNGSWGWYRGTMYASSGSHSVSITVDGTGVVPEENEADNILTATFSPVLPTDLPQTFVWPVAGMPNQDFMINNYVDVDPRLGWQCDYRGGPFTYDGHDALDIAAATFSEQDAGIPIVAAAAGTVVTMSDGHFDREVTANSRLANSVIIDHGNGWRSYYWHLAANSITVQVGETVDQGHLLGLMGSSGYSTGSHLHWATYYKNAKVETFYAPTAYWSSPLPYQGDATPTVMKSGISNYDPTNEMSEGPSTTHVFPTSQNWSAYYWCVISNPQSSSRFAATLYRPDGTVSAQSTPMTIGQRHLLRWWNFGADWKTVPGDWQVALTADGVEIDRRSFTVTTGEGVATAKLSQDVTYIVNGRLTPIDFGSYGSGGIPATKTFTITNHGSASLATSLASLPAGFSLSGTFPRMVPAGSSATFDVSLHTTSVGRRFGAIRIETNDADKPTYSFLVSGDVTGMPPAGTPALSSPGPAVRVESRAPVVLDPAADISDPDASTWGNSRLNASLITNGMAGDRLAIRNQGSLASLVGVLDNKITFRGTSVATFSGGTGTTPLEIVFQANATAAAVRGIIQNITYANVSLQPDNRPRFVGLVFTDATGKSSEQVVKRISAVALPAVALPAAPTDLVGTAGNGRVLLSWTASNSGGIPITDYRVQYSSNGGTSWSNFIHPASTATVATVTGLSNGTSYLFRVAAVNAAGTGADAALNSRLTPLATTTGRPKAVAGDGYVTLRWIAPAGPGRRPISDYAIRYSSDNGVTWSLYPHTPSTATSIRLPLVNGTPHIFQVAPIVSGGIGVYSAASLPVTPYSPIAKPAAPSGVVGVKAGVGVTLSWNIVAGNAGGSVTDYVVQYRVNRPNTPWWTYRDIVSPTTSSGLRLSTGFSYVFRVAAKNLAGVGTYSVQSVPMGV